MAPLPSYSSAEWRLDVELGRRSLLQTAEPTFVVKLDMAAPDRTTLSPVIFEADAAHMQHLETQLANAVAELNTVRTTRLVKYVK